jgi:hypothetical protein
MNQTEERNRVKARIKALTEKTVQNGCTEAEALSAAAMVGRLLERYALTMDEIEVRASRCVQIEVPLGCQKRRPIDGCVPAIARFCDCKVWLSRATKTGETAQPHYIFFGLETDAVLARYLYEVIERAMATEVARFKAAKPALRSVLLRRASASFQHGVAARVAARLIEIRAEREAHMAAQRVTGTALILAKHQVVEDAFGETGVKLVSSSALGQRRLMSAYREGWAAGERVNLNRPVDGASQGVLA